jgi:threonine dehydrogenase-like Zn-dependent dehydrogenase
MKALTFGGIEKINYESVADPKITQPADVVLKMKCCAICGSDLHVYYGRENGLDLHTCMGHEFAGEVVEVGKEVKSLRVGDVVISPFSINCGECFYCQIGLTSRCVKSQLFGWTENGIGLHGGQAEFVRVPLADSSLMKLPESVTIEEGVLAGDIISTGFYSAKQAQIKPQGIYVVIGCGPVGLMAILGARTYGAEKIYAVDREAFRLKMAEKFGAIPINTSNTDAVSVVQNASEGRGADAVMEAIGSEFSLHLSYQLLRPGGIISSVGVCNDKSLPFSPVQAYNKNITFVTGRCPARAMMPEVLKLIQEKKFHFTDIITHRLSLKDGGEGYKLFAAKGDNCLKVVLTP